MVSPSRTMAAGEDAARGHRGHRARRRDGAAPDFGAQPRAISSPKHSYHCAFPGRRNHRHAGAAVRATHVGRLKPKRGRGERRRSRRIARRRPSREGRPRRLYAAVPQHHLHDHHVVAAIRRALTSRYRAGLRADRGRSLRTAVAVVASVSPRTRPQGVRGLCEADERAAVLRFHRPGQRHEPDGRSAQTRHRDQDGSRPVPRWR